jgi:hypothetical protein
MKIAKEKTKSMTIVKIPLRCKLVNDDQLIEQVLKIRYLGIDITSQGLLEDEVKYQINKANRISGCLNDTVWGNKYISRETKSRIYKTIIRPILAYAAEARPDTAYSKKTLETAEMTTLKRMTRSRFERQSAE